MSLTRRSFAAGALVAALAAPVDAAELRIVALGGSITEIVYALGAGDRLVAVDTTSLYPGAVERLPKVGYLRTLSAEGILSLNPTVIVGTDDAGPPNAIDQLRAAGTRMTLIPEQFSPQGVAAKIRAVSNIVGAQERGDGLAKVIVDDLAAVSAALADVKRRPKVLFLLAVGRGAPLAAGDGTAAAAMIQLAGGENAMHGQYGYKPMSTEIAIDAAPDVLLMMQQTVDQIGGADEVFRIPVIAAMDAGRARRLVSFDGLYLLGFGPRTAQAALDLARRLHPEHPLPQLPRRAWAAAQ